MADTTMADTLSDLEKVTLATTTAETFTDSYYTALCSARNTLDTFYVPVSVSGRLLPHISYNGAIDQDATVFQQKFETMPFTYYEVQSLDAHVLNACIDPEIGAAAKAKGDKKAAEKNLSIIVHVNGFVRLFERKEEGGEVHGFSDSFVLVSGKAKIKSEKEDLDEGRRWVIQTQNFRFVT